MDGNEVATNQKKHGAAADGCCFVVPRPITVKPLNILCTSLQPVSWEPLRSRRRRRNHSGRSIGVLQWILPSRSYLDRNLNLLYSEPSLLTRVVVRVVVVLKRNKKLSSFLKQQLPEQLPESKCSISNGKTVGLMQMASRDFDLLWISPLLCPRHWALDKQKFEP